MLTNPYTDTDTDTDMHYITNYVAVVTLTSTDDKGETLKITFDCQAEEELDPTDEHTEEEGEREDYVDEDADLENPVGIRFHIDMTKSNGDRLVVEAVAAEDILIRGVQIIPADTKVPEDDQYLGPQFENLNEELQGAIGGYLEEKGIDADMSFFIVSYATHKEQQEYELWLERLVKFAEQN